MHNKLIVFDIETITDCDAGRRLLDLPKKMSDDEVIQRLENYHLEITDGKNKFIRQPFHKIVAISFLAADIIRSEHGEAYVVTDLRSGGKAESSEQELVSGFFTYLKNAKPRLVSFNGRGFDLPVLKYRAMLHKVDAKWLYHSGDKWNNYSSRYSLDWHCDLIEAFSDFGTSARVKMKELCAIFNLPGKIDVDGSAVYGLHKAGKTHEIRDYCELDVINTYLLYLIYSHHGGITSLDNHEKSKESLIEFIQSHPKDNFSKFINSWSFCQKPITDN